MRAPSSLIPAVLLAIALPCMGFGWWGLNTVAGNHMFDEMAGIVPFAVGVLGGLLVIAAGVTGWWLRRRAAGAKN